MTDHGYTRLSNPHFFRDLDRDRNGSLDFSEVLTLYYIVKSGRPLCNCCGILILGTFYSCVKCFDSPSTRAYSLCINCYRSNRSNHNHNGHQQFLDTYTLLETKRSSAMGRSGRNGNLNEITVPGQPAHFHTINMPPWPHPNPYTSNVILPEAQVHRLVAALTAFELALSIGSISRTICSIL
ncbi:hypothetical protein BUALT_Bualt14G0048600 [Buddleja alternifolia]|uniref:EF-hand domain-containing protein n=1 Tax=Buddleja alternifolia TaxID=168488 RepID=A0AAV6WI61_9LAMI|nr:hypothetical protein BUALT_Bualt14G0048600 [Buddleja alternifolia]